MNIDQLTNELTGSVGKPTAAVILLICRFFPSLIEISTQLVGIAFRSRIGGVRSQSQSGSSINFTFAGNVLPSFNRRPFATFALLLAKILPLLEPNKSCKILILDLSVND